MFKAFLFALLFFCTWNAGWVRAQEQVITVLFDYDKDLIPDSSMIQLIKWIHQHQVEKVLLEGHCDSIGSRVYNLDLSRRRAGTVQRLLTQNGIDRHSIKTCVGYGKDRPFTDNNTDETRQKNRRVHVTFYYRNLEPKPIVVRDTSATKVEEAKNVFDGKKLEAGQQIVLENMLFYPGRHILRPESLPELHALLKLLRANRNLVIEIHGHVCCTTTEPDGYDWDTDSHDLSLNRARFIYDYLISMGIGAKRLSYKGFGGTQKIHPDESDETLRAENRRVEIKIVSL
jgi:outer membrane protein OmpA-like peptidoglycan-associated protein